MPEGPSTEDVVALLAVAGEALGQVAGWRPEPVSKRPSRLTSQLRPFSDLPFPCPLPGGLADIEQLLPGFEAELVAGGAVRCDSMQEIRFVASGHEVTATRLRPRAFLPAAHMLRDIFGDAWSGCQT
jgi:hypothetical protein